ncbi:hypothetical protein, partial [Amycolatopsis sp. NPDC051372]|uniref:hypothetical protein n=1 Tax=Amycolatopsis sp. NPDC051372 TaxID=3155669 RepID=UPI0034456412
MRLQGPGDPDSGRQTDEQKERTAWITRLGTGKATDAPPAPGRTRRGARADAGCHRPRVIALGRAAPA